MFRCGGPTIREHDLRNRLATWISEECTNALKCGVTRVNDNRVLLLWMFCKAYDTKMSGFSVVVLKDGATQIDDNNTLPVNIVKTVITN
jgi:hypothetical protein